MHSNNSIVMKNSIYFFSIVFLFCQCGSIKNSSIEQTNEGLKEYYKNYFNIGVAVSVNSVKNKNANLILHEFNSVTAENSMKMGPIHPAENTYNWKDADTIMAFVKNNNLKIRGHNLCWHQQTPKWMFIDSVGKKVSKQILLARLKQHIFEVVGRYKGQIYAWDVVNEAISDAPNEYLRNSEWYQIAGEEYIAKAFEYAHEADPDALLFYNDYNEISATKRAKILKLVTQLKKEGVPINGLGLQGHWAINEPSYAQLDSTLSDFSKLGLMIQITELDISVYPKEHAARERQNIDTAASFSLEKETKQAAVYKYCFELFRKYKKYINSVTFWNISDEHSWLDNFPVKNRKDYPLLFDTNNNRKNAYWEVAKWEK